MSLVPTAPHLKPVQRQRSLGTLRSVSALILREMATTYGKSAGGYVWAILEPVAGIALFTVVFSLLVRSPPVGTNFAIFYATGMLPFVMYSGVSGKVTAAIMFSRPLLVYPSVTFLDAVIARFVLNYLTQLLVAYIVFTGIRTVYETRTSLDLPVIIMGFFMVGALALGLGLLNCFLVSMFPLWQRLWGIIAQPLLLVSCIFYTFESVPMPYRDYLWFNPLVHIIGEIRAGFYPTYDSSYVSVTYVLLLSLVLGVLGLVFLRRYHREILSI